MCLILHSLTLTYATPAPMSSRSCASTPQLNWVYLVHAGFQFGRVVMCFVKVAGVSTRLTRFFCTASHSHACHSVAPDFPQLRVYSPIPLRLRHLGFHFGCVVMRFVEVAGVSTRLTPFFSTYAS